MFCTKCGKKIGEGKKFCDACGTPLISDDAILNEVKESSTDSESTVYFTPLSGTDSSRSNDYHVTIGSGDLLSILKSLYTTPNDSSADLEPDTDIDLKTLKPLPLFKFIEQDETINGEEIIQSDLSSGVISQKNTEKSISEPDDKISTDSGSDASASNSIAPDGIFAPLPKVEPLNIGGFVNDDNIHTEEKSEALSGEQNGDPVFDREFMPSADDEKNKTIKTTEPSMDNSESSVRTDEKITAKGWVGILFLMLIPAVNLVFLVFWAFGGCRKQEKIVFSRAALAFVLITAAVTLLLFTVFKGPMYTLLSTLFTFILNLLK